MTDPILAALSDYDETLIRKWGSKILGVAPMSVAMPATFFDNTSHLPLAFPQGTFSLGGITTDGIKEAIAIKTDEVDIDQSTAPARVDMTSKISTLHVSFSEATAWTHALRAGIPFDQWPEDKHAAFGIDEGDARDFPFMRLFVIARDGEGDSAHYRVEAALRAQVSDLGDRTLARASQEAFDTTFTLFQDPADSARRSHLVRQDGPGYTTHLTAA